MRPNIVFAFADDWGRYASAYRNQPGEGTIHELIETPNFDRIAAEGALFLNAHVPAPRLHTMSKLDTVGQVLLADGIGGNSHGGKVGRKHTELPSDTRRGRLSYRIHIQGMDSRTDRTCSVWRRAHRIRICRH